MYLSPKLKHLDNSKVLRSNIDFNKINRNQLQKHISKFYKCFEIKQKTPK